MNYMGKKGLEEYSVSAVYGLVPSGSMTSWAEGCTDLCLQKGEKGDPK